MSELFTTFESLQPPEIQPPEAKETSDWYQEIQQPDIQDIDYFNEQPEKDIEPPNFDQQPQDAAQNIVSQARQFVGTKYSWGGSNPTTGFDCSGLMQYVFKNAGINLPRTAMQQGKVGQEVNLQQAQPGDIIWFGSKNSPSGQHIGLISKIDNGQIYIIDAAGKKLGVTERLLPNLQIKSIRRLLGGANNFSLYALNFFKQKGLTDSQARGIVGNLMQESAGNHNIVNNKSGAFGLAQWLGSRKQKLKQQYGNNPTIEQQLEYIWQELNTTESSAFQKLLNTNTIEGATKAFAKHFERAGQNEMNMNSRINYAYQA